MRRYEQDMSNIESPCCMRIRGLGRQCECPTQKWRPRHKHGKGLSHVEYYHLRRPRRARALDKGRRPRRDDRRGALGHLRLRRRRSRGAGCRRVDPCRQMRLRVRRHRVRPAEEARSAGRRLRRRRGLEDDQALGRPQEEERPQRRGVPGPHAVGRQRRGGVGSRRRVRGGPRPGPAPSTTPART